MHKICIDKYIMIRLFSWSNQMEYLSIDLSGLYYVYVTVHCLTETNQLLRIFTKLFK